MKPISGEYEKYESDVNKFIHFILRFEISISEYPETYSLSFEEMLPLLDEPAEDGSVHLRYFFYINNCEYWEYDLELDNKFNLYKRGIKELQFLTEYGIPYPGHLISDLKYLEKARIRIEELDFSKFTKETKVLVGDSKNLVKGNNTDMKIRPHHNIEKYRERHLKHLNMAIEILKELVGVHSERELHGISIKIPFRGSSNENIKALFEFLQKKYELENLDHFIDTFTGQPMEKMYLWPQKHSTGLKLLIQGLIKEKCIEGIKTNTVPWKTITQIFCNEDGIPYSNNLKSSGHKTYEDDIELLSAIKRMKGERKMNSIKPSRG